MSDQENTSPCPSCESYLNHEPWCPFDTPTDQPVPVTVKRPYMRTAPCAVLCRGDGNQVSACIGDDPHTGVWGFGDTLADALRNLADGIEAEVEVKVR